MPTKTISLRVEAYEKLRAARRFAGESFSEVVLRAEWPEDTVTAGGLLRELRERGPLLGDEELDRIERAKRSDSPPEDKWHLP